MSSTLVWSFPALDGTARLGVLAKRAYALHSGGRARPSAASCPIRTAAEWVAPEGDGPVHFGPEADFGCFFKPVTDVVVSGSVHAPRGATRELDCGVAVGPVRRALHVVGDRQVQLGAAHGLGFGAPDGFTRMPLSWERAYGGRDLGAEERRPRRARFGRGSPSLEELADGDSGGAWSYPRNRVGRGFFIDVDRERLAGAPLPNFEDPEDRLTPERMLARDAYDWLARPVAAGLGAVDPFTFPRCMFSFVRPEVDEGAHVREVALGALGPADLAPRELDEPPSPRFFNCGAPGLAVARLSGGERVTLWRLHREHERLELELPHERPRMLVEPPNTRAYELEPALGTVWLRPDEDLLELTWAGSMPVAAVFPPEMCRDMRHAVAY